MPEPSLRQLRTFLAVVETGSVSAAARLLHLTQPAVSQQLRELERGLGVRLLERAAGRMIPNAAGAALVVPARRAISAAEDAVVAVAEHGQGETGRLRLGTGATACIHLLPPVLQRVKAAMPGLVVTVAIGNTAEILPRLEAGDLDVVLATLPVPASRALSTTRLLSDPLLALLPAVGIPPGQGPITAKALGAWPLILYEENGNTRAATDAWFRRAGVKPEPVMAVGSVEAIKTLVGLGLGAAVLPALALSKSPPGTVTRSLRPAATRSLGCVLRKEKVLDRGLRLFLTELNRSVEAADPS